MTKKVYLFIALLLAVFSVSFLIGSKPVTTIQACNPENCGFTCPVIHYTWQTRELDVAGHYVYADKESVVDVAGHYSCESYSGYHLDGTKCKKSGHQDKNAVWVPTTYKLSCPSGYSTYSGHSNCRKWIDDSYKTTNHSVDIAYEKSNDNNKCHRPSDDTLEHTYGLDHDRRNDFKQHNDEWKDGTPTSCPSPTPTNTPTAEPTKTCEEDKNCPTETPVPTGEVTGTPAPEPTNPPGDNGSGGNPPGPPVCNDTDPGAPANLKAVALGGGKVKLTWDNAPGPHTTYAVAYGPSIGNYLYGDPNVGNVTTYTVLALNPGGNYCFYVQAQNGCKGGVPSNVVCTNQPGTIRVLGATDNYNPLVEGIRDSYGGQVLGAATQLMGTAEVVYSSDKLPSGNTLLEGRSISIPAIGVNQAVYRPQIIADQLAVGQHEVLNTSVNGSDVYYGHNGYDIFGSLYKVVKGDQVIVVGGNQKSVYTVTDTAFVQKDNIDSIKTVANQIVLVTCSFTQPDYRIVVKASLQP